MTVLQPDELFACLDRHHVQYVLVGGLAAVLYGSPLPTVDVDICPSRDRENLTRLASALRELDARIRSADTPTGVPFPVEATFLSSVELLNLQTRVGDLDLVFVLAGGSDYEILARRARAMRVRDFTIHVAALDDVIRSKEAADRPKDRRGLPVLRQLLEELQRRGQD